MQTPAIQRGGPQFAEELPQFHDFVAEPDDRWWPRPMDPEGRVVVPPS